MENVIIIGGGPAGLSAAIYTARAGLSPLVFAGSPAGGQLMLTSQVENYPGFESILGAELIQKMRHQAEKFGARIVDENVVKVDFLHRPFNIYLHQDDSSEILPQLNSPARGGLKHPVSKNFGSPFSDSSQKNFISSSTVLIATGAKALWLNVPGEQPLRGKGVSACATCDGFFFKDKVVAVVGGGDTAMEEALTLTKFAKKVYIIHRRNRFRASKIMQERVLKHPKIEIIWNTVVEEVLGKEKVEGIRINRKTENRDQKTEDGKSESVIHHQSSDFRAPSLDLSELKLDGLFVAIGHKPDTDIFAGQVEMDEKGYIITSERLAIEYIKFKMQNSKFKMTIQNEKLEKIIDKFNLNFKTMTSLDGVFAAGDCVDFVYRQAGTAAGQGIAAALEVERYLEINRDKIEIK